MKKAKSWSLAVSILLIGMIVLFLAGFFPRAAEAHAEATDNKLDVALSVNGEKAFSYDGMLNRDAEIEGVRYLWNISSSVDTVVLSDLVKA